MVFIFSFTPTCLYVHWCFNKASILLENVCTLHTTMYIKPIMRKHSGVLTCSLWIVRFETRTFSNFSDPWSTTLWNFTKNLGFFKIKWFIKLNWSNTALIYNTAIYGLFKSLVELQWKCFVKMIFFTVLIDIINKCWNLRIGFFSPLFTLNLFAYNDIMNKILQYNTYNRFRQVIFIVHPRLASSIYTWTNKDVVK